MRREHFFGLATAFLIATSAVMAQQNTATVIAQQGDGIFSLLRRQGLDPVKYYAEFVGLNQQHLKNGSQLAVGGEYIIPVAGDSYRDMGIAVDLDSGEESPIFGEDYSKMTHEGKLLENSVYFLLTTKDQASQTLTKELSRTLMAQGAKVYLFTQNHTANGNSEGVEALKQTVSAINDRYLKNMGRYQRLVEVQVTNGPVQVNYHKANQKSWDMAEGIAQILVGQGVENGEKLLANFSSNNELYLVRNTLPTMNRITIGSQQSTKAMAAWIAKGMMVEHQEHPEQHAKSRVASTQFED